MYTFLYFLSYRPILIYIQRTHKLSKRVQRRYNGLTLNKTVKYFWTQNNIVASRWLFEFASDLSSSRLSSGRNGTEEALNF